MEENQTKHPAWLTAAQEWQEEDSDTRSVIIIASDKEDGVRVCLQGPKVLALNNLYQIFKQEASYLPDIINMAQEVATKGGTSAELLEAMCARCFKEHGIKYKAVDADASDADTEVKDDAEVSTGCKPSMAAKLGSLLETLFPSKDA